jgi:hypothetical protein
MDFDENSLAAFDQAVEIARHFEGTLKSFEGSNSTRSTNQSLDYR